MQFFFYLAFFLSGFSALVYELVWVRKMVLVFGNTAYAVATVISIFFLGLAIGSFLIEYILAKIKDKQVIKLYAVIELGIGIFALLTIALFPPLHNLPLPAVISPLTILIIIAAASLIMLPVTILIGSTLPIMIKLYSLLKIGQPGETIGRNAGRIYAINTLGGVAGVFISGFFLIAYAGLNQTLVIASGINIAIGWLFFILSKKKHLSGNIKTSEIYKKYDGKMQLSGVSKTENSNFRRLLYLAFFCSGTAALSLEVLLTRALILSFGGSTYSFSTILTTFLLGIVLGSALITKLLADKKWQQKAAVLFAWILVANSILIIVILPLIEQLPWIFLKYIYVEGTFVQIQLLVFVLSFIIILPVTVLMGATFPLVVTAIGKTIREKSTTDIGKIYAVNTLGGISGSLVAGFVLISLLGVEKSIVATSLFYLFAGGLILYKLLQNPVGKIILAIGVISITIISLSLPSWSKKTITMGPFIYYREMKNKSLSEIRSDLAERELLYFKDGLSANVAVFDTHHNRFLRIDGKTDASSSHDLSTQLLIGHLPLMLAQNPKEILVIGLGSGITLGAVTTYPVENIDMVEIEPAVVEAASYFKDYNNDALSDPRVKLIINDGRNYLQRIDKKYDVISSEPSNTWVSGQSNLYTLEYFQQAKKHLNDDGVMLHWVQLFKLSDFSLSSLIRTFSTVFPYVSLWTPYDTNDLLMVGSIKPHQLNQERLEKLFANEKIKADLARIYIFSPKSILRNYLLDSEGVKKVAQKGIIHLDNRPFLEFITPLDMHNVKVYDNIKLLFRYRSHNFEDIFPATLSQTEQKREILARDSVLSSLIVMEDDLEKSINLLEAARDLEPDSQWLNASLAIRYFKIAQKYFAENNMEKAEDYLLKTIGVEPNNSLAHSNLAGIYLTKNILDKAKEELDKAISISPKRTEPHINLALYYQRTGEEKKAIEELEKTLNIDPQNEQAKGLLGSIRE